MNYQVILHLLDQSSDDDQESDHVTNNSTSSR